MKAGQLTTKAKGMSQVLQSEWQCLWTFGCTPKEAQSSVGEDLLSWNEGCRSESFTALASGATAQGLWFSMPLSKASLRNEVHTKKLLPKPLKNSELWSRSDGLQQPQENASQTSGFRKGHWSMTTATGLWNLLLCLCWDYTWMTKQPVLDSPNGWLSSRTLQCPLQPFFRLHRSSIYQITFPFSFTWGQTCMTIWLTQPSPAPSPFFSHFH